MNMMRPLAAKTILLCADAGDAAQIRAVPGWTDRFDEVAEGGAAALSGRYDVLVPYDQPHRPPLLGKGARVAFLCTELTAFEAALRNPPPGDLVFMPSALARLDVLVRTRRTLKAARDLPRGAVLAAADLAYEVGGHGAGADCAGRIIGRSALYDLPEGAPLDFGVVG
ncbi:MAG TPA: SAF domain-containing protein [Azospirillum sp.]